MKFIGYIRVSTQEQAKEGYSLSAQRERIETYCKAYGHELVDLKQEAQSAKDSKRPQLKDALDRIMNDEADGLLVCKLDRFARNLKDTVNIIDSLHQKNKYLISIDENVDTRSSISTLLIGMLGSFAQFENDRRAERIKAGISEKRKLTGLQKIGGKTSELNPDPITLEESDQWFELYKQGVGIRKIAADFRRHKTTVHNILVRKRKAVYN